MNITLRLDTLKNQITFCSKLITIKETRYLIKRYFKNHLFKIFMCLLYSTIQFLFPVLETKCRKEF